MGKKGYHEKEEISTNEMLERIAQMNGIQKRFDKLKEDIAKSNGHDIEKIESEFIEYLQSLGNAYEIAISPTLDITAHANPCIYAMSTLLDLDTDQLTDCFEKAVDVFNVALEKNIKSYCDINNEKKRDKSYVN